MRWEVGKKTPKKEMDNPSLLWRHMQIFWANFTYNLRLGCLIVVNLYPGGINGRLCILPSLLLYCKEMYVLRHFALPYYKDISTNFIIGRPRKSLNDVIKMSDTKEWDRKPLKEMDYFAFNTVPCCNKNQNPKN